MDGISCDRCGKSLLVEEPVRYEAVIEIKAAYDPLELTRDDLAADLREEIARALRELDGIGGSEAMDQVFKRLAFDLCPACRRAFLENPLGRKAGTEPRA
jgi:hypothetical protein